MTRVKVPTRVTSNSSTIIDLILASHSDRVTQQGIIDVGLLDHQLIFCTRKFSMIKRGSYKLNKFCLFKDYSADHFENILTSIDIPNYQSFNDATEVHNEFIQKVMTVIDK